MEQVSQKEKKESSVLAQNMRFLRKSNRMSQEDLAHKLGIKRSNVAAYESKNVEPRLAVMLEIAKLFDIRLQTLIEDKLESMDYPKNADADNLRDVENEISFAMNEDVDQFIDKSEKIRKILEGFKAFYGFKKENLDDDFPNKEKLIFDIDNFLQLMEHLLNYNESVIKAINAQSVQQDIK